MTLKEFALNLRNELKNNQTSEKAREIIFKIEKAQYEDGSYLSPWDKEEVVKYIECPIHDIIQEGQEYLEESDNEEFLKLVKMIKEQVKK